VLDTVVRPGSWAKETAHERRRAQRDDRIDYDWDTYVSEAGHDVNKMRVVRPLAELVESSTPWTSNRFRNYIVVLDAGERALVLQFWGSGPALPSSASTERRIGTRSLRLKRAQASGREFGGGPVAA
jgi:hypothetical protein